MDNIVTKFQNDRRSYSLSGTEFRAFPSKIWEFYPMGICSTEVRQIRKHISDPGSLNMFAGRNTHKKHIDGKISRRRIWCYSSRECSARQTSRKAAHKSALGSALFEKLMNASTKVLSKVPSKIGLHVIVHVHVDVRESYEYVSILKFVFATLPYQICVSSETDLSFCFKSRHQRNFLLSINFLLSSTRTVRLLYGSLDSCRSTTSSLLP